MSSNDFYARPIDLKRFWRQFRKRIWMVVAATVVGAVLGLLIYVLYSNVMSGNTVYQIRNDYYITFNHEEFPNGVDYYNAYTWDGILRDDPIVNKALEVDSGITKAQILESVKGEILGDYRILTVVVTGTDKELVQKISDAYKTALPAFADIIDMIKTIEVWTDADIEVYDAYTREPNAAFLGGLIGLLVSLFAVLLYGIFDDAIYTERDWALRYPKIPYLGKRDTDEYNVNRSHLLQYDGNYIELASDQFRYDLDEFDRMRKADGVILKLKPGKDNTDEMDKVVYTLLKQDVKIVGVME
jgi:capsular polysaccharide biosynthesis protein